MLNKIERKEMEDLRTQLAFVRTVEVLPDVHPPALFQNELSTGFTFNSYSRTINASCSSCVGHSLYSQTATSSQKSISLFSTKVLALRALRFKLEEEFAVTLRDIDKRIEAAKGDT